MPWEIPRDIKNSQLREFFYSKPHGYLSIAPLIITTNLYLFI